MALDKRPLPVPFGQGIDTKTDSKQVQLGKLLEASNVTFNRGGSLTKRAGFRKVAPIAESVLAQGPAQTLLTLAQERLVVAGHQLHSYSPAARSWTAKGPLRSLGQTTVPVYADAFEQTCPDLAIANGVSLAAFQTTEHVGAIRVVLTDEATGARLFSSIISASLSSDPRCVACGPWLYCFFTYNTNLIGWTRFSSTHPDAGHTLNGFLSTGHTPTDVWEVIETGGVLVLAYFDTGGHLNVAWLPPDPSGILVVGGPSNGYPPPYQSTGTSPDRIALAMAAGPDHIGLAWSIDTDGTGFHLLGVTLDHQLIVTRPLGKLGATPDGPNVSRIGLTYSDLLGSFYVVFECPAALPYNTSVLNTRLRLIGDGGSGDVGTTQTLFRSLGLASEPFVQDGQVHVWLTYDGGPLSPQNTVFLASVSAAGIVLEAKALAGRAAGLAASYRLSRPAQGSQGVWSTAQGSRNLFKVGLNSSVSFTKNASRVSLDFTRECWDSAELARSLHMAGAQVHGYDGLGVVEHGFPIVPEVGQSGTTGFDLEVVVAKSDVAQVVKITPPPDDSTSFPVAPSGSRITPGSYILIWDYQLQGFTSPPTTGPIVSTIWFTVDGVGSNIIDFTPGTYSAWVQVDLLSNDSQVDVAKKIALAMNGADADRTYAGRGVNTGSPTASHDPGDPFLLVTAIHKQQETGLTHHYGMGFPLTDSQMGYDVVETGVKGHPGVAEWTRLTFPAGKWISSGQWFQLESDKYNDDGLGGGPGDAGNDTVCFYFVVDGAAPTPVPAPPSANGFKAININSSDTPQQVATAVSGIVAGTLTTTRTTSTYFTTTLNGPCVGVLSVANAAGSHNTILITSAQTGGSSPSIRNNNVGGDVKGGSYSLYAIYEWTDAQGQYHRSAPSSPLKLHVGASDGSTMDGAGLLLNQHNTQASILWSVSTLRCSRKKQVRIGLFRTRESGQYPKRVATLVNDPAVDSVSFVDGFQDSFLESAETIYTQVGEVANDAPPAAQAICVWQGRMVLGAIDSDPLSLWPSKALGDGYGAAFSSLLSLRVPGDGGAVTALAVMDQELVIFKAGRIYVLSGEGPSNGAQGQWGVPVELTTDEGCSNPASIVLTDEGLLFQGNKGICLLSRQLVVSYIGAPAEAFGRLTITSALTLPAVHQVRWTTKEGPSLVYDTFFQQWGTNTYRGLAARVWAGLYTVLRADGAVLVETPGLYTDDGVPVQLRVSTAWLKPAQVLQGFGRVYKVFVLGRYASTHRLRLQAAYDYDDGTVQDMVFDAKEVLGSNAFGTSSPMGAGTPFGDTAAAKQYQLRAYPKTQKCEAIRITITDLDSSAGESCSRAELMLEVGVKAGSYKLPNKNSIG